MSSITLTINGRRRTVNVAADTPLLWVLRDTLGLTGSGAAPRNAVSAVKAGADVQRATS